LHVILSITLVLLFIPPLRGDDSASTTNTLIADALDWYSVWHGKRTTQAGVQKCRGELKGNMCRFRCDPLSVVADVDFDDSGSCIIGGMRPSMRHDFELHPQWLFSPPRHVRRQECGELPKKDGDFEIAVNPHRRDIDQSLTARARDAALSYNQQVGDTGCVLHFPNVKAGDPFFHVYAECHGTLQRIYEFTIHHGQVADFPHWTYTSWKEDLLPWTEWRLNQRSLWFGVSRPSDRAK
jgi:hypothetical protein